MIHNINYLTNFEEILRNYSLSFQNITSSHQNITNGDIAERMAAAQTVIAWTKSLLSMCTLFNPNVVYDQFIENKASFINNIIKN